MKKVFLRFLSLALCLCCTVSAWGERFPLPGGATPYSQMEYVRPDLEQMRQTATEVCLRAQGNDVSSILEGVFAFYDEYDWFFTASALADLGYCADMTDGYWEEENRFCAASAPAVQQMLDELNAALAGAPCRRELEREFFGEGFFDDYDTGQSWDGELVALLERESQLISRYYSQWSRTNSLLGTLFPRYDEMAQTLVDLIGVRNQMAAYTLCDSYEDFANDSCYYRDYAPEELAGYLEDIRDTLVPLYLEVWETMESPEECSEDQALDYVRQTAQAMGGRVQSAFRLMERAGLYDIGYGRHKYDSSFEVYLPSYQEPFLFMNPTGTAWDCLTLAHEFGHFCNDYASGGSLVDVDVSEIFSQGLEYLSLCCHPESQALTRYKMADSLSTYVEQACYAKFEREMYQIPQEELSVEALCRLFEEVSQEYGMKDSDFGALDFVTIGHFYTNPMYLSSYILSNDAALQLYQLECASPGRGQELYQRSLDTQELYFLAFLDSAGLESPFAPGRLEQVEQTFRQFFSAA